MRNRSLPLLLLLPLLACRHVPPTVASPGTEPNGASGTPGTGTIPVAGQGGQPRPNNPVTPPEVKGTGDRPAATDSGSPRDSALRDSVARALRVRDSVVRARRDSTLRATGARDTSRPR